MIGNTVRQVPGGSSRTEPDKLRLGSLRGRQNRRPLDGLLIPRLIPRLIAHARNGASPFGPPGDPEVAVLSPSL